MTFVALRRILRRGMPLFAVFAALLFLPSPLLADDGAPHLPGAGLSLVWTLPFVGMLLSIALGPLVAPDFWHRHFGKISLFWALAFLVPCALVYGIEIASYEAVHALLLEYLPFIVLLFALFTVSGGVRLKGSLVGGPGVNTGILVVGTILANLMGTTGAAMLLIRPLLRANEHRRYKVHTVIFFIFLVANIGGSLTPLGDPPLFLGFLKGISFFWPLQNMAGPMLLVSGILIPVYYITDRILLAKEGGLKTPATGTPEKAGIEGGINLVLLAGIVASVLMSGYVRLPWSVEIHHVTLEAQNLLRDALMLAIAGLSLLLTRAETRERNGFTWFPIVEVGKLFIGIFLAMIPAIAILKAGESGSLAWAIALVSDAEGNPINVGYFLLTGCLSAFLDNAPTYLVFFNMAGGDAAELMTTLSPTLLAISAGSVFIGALTYIGNAPNFMVRSIAQDAGVNMPSFFGYMVWSCGILIPVLAILTLVYFV
ncbi:sodium:proton antiporter [Phaeovibrio sulfidiphilus]|uniref:Sodium:proton antiporter n=1 Tax=Phaeovibrio sulfidiphilus TaxID=1220600 RepID=A0A8J6YVN8_9PROT|nr:sodium:proton antiporter [Phaeovibrio sulfidiphilus]MBE1236582.1 sodium:proton antiporter [Phaeovibrio sulfidiphilus]